MIEHIARFPRVRDRALFVGSPETSCRTPSATGLPAIRAVGRGPLRLRGHVLRPDAGAPLDRAALRAELGYGPDERVCIVTVGGSGVGGGLLRRVIEASPRRGGACPGCAWSPSAGRASTRTRSRRRRRRGARVRPRASRHLAACDVAVVQGGLTTCMELAAAGRPFVYFPLRAPLRAEPPRAPPPGALRRGSPAGLRLGDARDDRRRDRGCAAPTPQAAGVERDGAARAAQLIAERHVAASRMFTSRSP